MQTIESTVIASAEAANKGEIYSTEIKVQNHSFVADEPAAYGGKDTGPAPGAYLCAALASCTAITLRMYAERKKWKVTDINVTVTLTKGSSTATSNHTFLCEVAVTGDLNDQQQSRLLEIAKACPIHRLLCKPSELITVRAERKGV